MVRTETHLVKSHASQSRANEYQFKKQWVLIWKSLGLYVTRQLIWLQNSVLCSSRKYPYSHYSSLNFIQLLQVVFSSQQNWKAKKIELRMKNHCGESVGFPLRAALWFLHWIFLFKALWDQCYNSTFFLFSPSSVLILLAFLSCFLVFFFFVKDQIASFQLKQIVVFLN